MTAYDPAFLQRLIDAGLKRIAEKKALMRYDEHNVLILPTVCWFCENGVYDIALINGDGIPICRDCFERQVAALGGDT